jgi:hypothetical protein
LYFVQIKNVIDPAGLEEDPRRGMGEEPEGVFSSDDESIHPTDDSD